MHFCTASCSSASTTASFASVKSVPETFAHPAFYDIQIDAAWRISRLC